MIRNSCEAALRAAVARLFRGGGFLQPRAPRPAGLAHRLHLAAGDEKSPGLKTRATANSLTAGEPAKGNDPHRTETPRHPTARPKAPRTIHDSGFFRALSRILVTSPRYGAP